MELNSLSVTLVYVHLVEIKQICDQNLILNSREVCNTRQFTILGHSQQEENMRRIQSVGGVITSGTYWGKK